MWNTVASPSRARCTVAVEAADCFTFSASAAQMVFEVRAETDRPIVWRTLVL